MRKHVLLGVAPWQLPLHFLQTLKAPTMPRRAQSGIKASHLIAIIAMLLGGIGGGWSLLHRGSDPMTGLTPISLEEYLDGSNALSGNTYKVEGVIDHRLDAWKNSDRLFSVQISDGGNFVPVMIPSDLEANIQRGQRYLFKVRVLDNGILEVIQLIKA
jgi:hypothetical protein